MPPAQTRPPPASRILLATDLSCRCDRAFDRALALAVEWRVKLTVVVAVEEAFDEPSWRSHRAAATEAVKAELGPQLDASGVEWDALVRPGSPADVIRAAAGDDRRALILTGVARNELLGRSRPGRTVETLLREAPAPVLSVKTRGRAPYRHALVPTDFTAAAENALIRAVNLFPETRFVLLHAYRTPFAGFLSEKDDAADFRREGMEAQRLFEQRLAPRLLHHDLPESLLEYGLVDELVLDYAANRHPDLVVLGAHDPADWLANAVTGWAPKIIAAVRCDVLAVPEKA